MTPKEFCSLLENKFPYEPTISQRKWFLEVSDFLFSKNSNTVFVLKGYAGTGKTTLIGSLVDQLKHIGFRSVLLAPTGRAAKVMTNYSKVSAFTIHKKIYYPKLKNSGKIFFKLKPNKHKKTVFIIDEASMIGDDSKSSTFFENGSLLSDVIQYVSQGNDCKLIFVGDPAQLPPVEINLSPALNLKELNYFQFENIYNLELEDVVRQALGSGILKNATYLRIQLSEENYEQFKFDLDGVTDINHNNNGLDLFDSISVAFDNDGIDQTVFIVRSNKRANLFNEHIRNRIFGWDDELCVGDRLMVVKNNYFWLALDSQPGFIANGDVVEIQSIGSRKNIYGFSFAEVSVYLVDYPDENPFETIIMLDTLKSENPCLSFEDGNKLYQRVLEDYSSEKSNYKKFLKVKNNRFFNSLQVKYSYAITCHKSQGGQWENVFVEKPYLPQGPNKNYLRWLYTAITRAKKNLYLIGFPNEDFKSIH
tara:strand:+ start:75 stop:1505 length:1431 start_codon:yes stop_codon:yes gene_type:complete